MSDRPALARLEAAGITIDEAIQHCGQRQRPSNAVQMARYVAVHRALFQINKEKEKCQTTRK